MSIFGTIMNKIFHHGQAAAPAPIEAAPSPAATPAPVPQAVTPAVAPVQQPAATAAPAQPVDVEAVLSQMAQGKDAGLDWQSSIVDLLKLLDMDSSLSARKELAGELSVHVGNDGTPEENMALHKAVMQKLAESGGKVPDALKG